MYFKPRIFISSTLNIKSIRKDIEEHFISVGAEPILYERDLTPSINPLTYREDILESDFVIFVFHQEYGNKTDSGKSGTHEEWDIINSSNIPKHVYIKRSKKDKKLVKFITSDIQKRFISFYYYDSESDLLNQIKKTTFTIAKNIALYKIEESKISDSKIRKLAINSDYKKALWYFKLIEQLYELSVDIIVYTTALDSLLDVIIQHARSYKYRVFFMNELNDSLRILFSKGKEILKLQLDNFEDAKIKEIYLEKVDIKLEVKDLIYKSDFNTRELYLLSDDFYDEYRKFRAYVLDFKSDADLII